MELKVTLNVDEYKNMLMLLLRSYHLLVEEKLVDFNNHDLKGTSLFKDLSEVLKIYDDDSPLKIALPEVYENLEEGT